MRKTQGNQTELVKRSLVGYILDTNLAAGNKLPPQAELRRRLGVGNATISRAIDELRRDGVLEVRDKVGVFLLDPNADGHVCRNVAVLSIRMRESMFFGVLSSFLQVELMRRGCRMVLFDCQVPSPKPQAELTDFPGLRRGIESGEFQGMIHFEDLYPDIEELVTAAAIPALKIGGTNIPRRDGIYFDLKDLLRRAMSRLWSEGVERPAILIPQVLETLLKNDYLELLKLFRNDPSCRIFAGFDMESGVRLAHEFAAIPRKDRPDGLIVFDDIIGGGFCSQLSLLLPPEQLPFGAIIRNLQLNIAFALPRRVFYDIDLGEFARLTAGRIVSEMKGAKPETDCCYYDIKESKRLI